MPQSVASRWEHRELRHTSEVELAQPLERFPLDEAYMPSITRFIVDVVKATGTFETFEPENDPE
ncbi:hypothetical protein [Phaeobacter porticola]|uniref:Uncharacterized protein n=1 Tax=Phaeobacter porticola TaxID=1844006 RepID=A0A1L3IAM0_9RHOB|nr:hypothetical protein [Phaeobacter porticola]APG49122.1 hypothetical protein PhaeoP97_03772 [Phaeobacter porticola]